jgi:hypothetical protein
MQQRHQGAATDDPPPPPMRLPVTPVRRPVTPRWMNIETAGSRHPEAPAFNALAGLADGGWRMADGGWRMAVGCAARSNAFTPHDQT